MRKGAQSSVESWTGFLPFNESVDHEVEAFEPEEIDFPPPEILLLDPSSYLRYPVGLKAADLSMRCDICVLFLKAIFENPTKKYAESLWNHPKSIF